MRRRFGTFSASPDRVRCQDWEFTVRQALLRDPEVRVFATHMGLRIECLAVCFPAPFRTHLGPLGTGDLHTQRCPWAGKFSPVGPGCERGGSSQPG